METYFEKQVRALYEKVNTLVDAYAIAKARQSEEKYGVDIPKELENEFFTIIDKVNLSLMEDKDNFYGYFLFQMVREIRFDISTPTAINFKNAKYVMYFNPIIFLNLNMKQMECSIKHEILHVISMHLVRAKELKGKYSTLAINMAMDIVVNKHLEYLPPYATTLQWVNNKYALKLQAYEPFEYYVENIQAALNLLDEHEEGKKDDTRKNEKIETEYNPEKTHNIWEESNDVENEMLRKFLEKVINNSHKSEVPTYLEDMLSEFKNSKGELPWNLYLKRLMGTMESNKKKTITRRNRRQPNRLDLRGELRDHKAKIAVALDTSGSISNEEFKQAIKEVLHIVKNYKHEITVIECDEEIRKSYSIKTAKDIKDRSSVRGGTKFTPVFEHANNKRINLLIYFTDGKGEKRLEVKPKGYKVLWVISGRGDKLSLVEPYGVVKKLGKVKAKEIKLEVKDLIDDGYSMNNQAPII